MRQHNASFKSSADSFKRMLGRCRPLRHTSLSVGGLPRGEACLDHLADLSEVRLIFLEVRVHQAHNEPTEKRSVNGRAGPSLKQLAQEDRTRKLWRKHNASMRREGFETWGNDLHNFKEVGVHDRHLPNESRLSCGGHAEQ